MVKGLEYTRYGVVTINTGRAYSYPCDWDHTKSCWILQGDWTQPYDQVTLKIDIGTEEWSGSIWTSTPSPTDPKSAVVVSPELTFKPVLRTKTNATHLSSLTALCVRPVEPEILEIAKDAQVGAPVPDLQTLKANVPLTSSAGVSGWTISGEHHPGSECPFHQTRLSNCILGHGNLVWNAGPVGLGDC
jgi:hypothetical protein